MTVPCEIGGGVLRCVSVIRPVALQGCHDSEIGRNPRKRARFSTRGTIQVMGGDEAVAALTALAKKAGIEVRIEPFGLKQLAGKGGLCRIRGRRVILVDAALAPLEQAGV